MSKSMVVYIVFIFISFDCDFLMSKDRKGGVVEVHIPDSVKGEVEIMELDSTWKMIDSAQIVNGKYIYEYPYREMPTIALLRIHLNAEKNNPKNIWFKNPYDPIMNYGNIVLDNSHTIIHAIPNMKNYFSCTHEEIKGSGIGHLEINLPDSIHGLVYLRKLQNSQFLMLDSASIVDKKCVFHYNSSEVTDERISFVVKQTNSVILPEEKKAKLTWNFLLKNYTHIKANAIPKRICSGIIATVAGSPETDIQLQLMSNSSACRDQKGHVSQLYIQKHQGSKLLLKEVFNSRSSFSSVKELKQVFSLFSENVRQSTIGEKMVNYVKARGGV